MDQNPNVVESKNTRLYFAVPGSSSEIHMFVCATGVQNIGGGTAGQIDITHLQSTQKQYVRGLPNPGQITIPFLFIPRSRSHQAILALKASGQVTSFMVVFSDQEDGPTELDSNGRLVSPGPTTNEFQAYVADAPIETAGEEVSRGSLTLQRSGADVWDLPATDLVD